MMQEEIFNHQIPNLLEVLKTFEYGIVVQGKLFPAKRYDKYVYYRSLTPEEFNKHKGGLCWDFTAYESYVFKECFPIVKFKLYYIEGGNEPVSTHTFLVYWNEKNKPVLFESMLAGCKGCFEFKTEKELLQFMGKKFFQYNPTSDYFIVEFKQPEDFGLTAKEYMDYVVSTGKLRVQKGKYYESII